MSKPWHAMEVDEVLKELGVNREGLSSQEALERLKRYGPNAVSYTHLTLPTNREV